jgi:hypothetical protein
VRCAPELSGFRVIWNCHNDRAESASWRIRVNGGSTPVLPLSVFVLDLCVWLENDADHVLVQF